MTFTTPICDIMTTVGAGSRNISHSFSSLSFSEHYHHHHNNNNDNNNNNNTSTIANVMAHRSSLPFSPTMQRHGDESFHSNFSPRLSTTGSSTNARNSVIAILDAALEIVEESSSSNDIILVCSDEFSDDVTDDEPFKSW
jgi:hypothetical protein